MLDYNVRILEVSDNCDGLAVQWNKIVETHSDSIMKLDVTCTFDWSLTLWNTFLRNENRTILLVESNGDIAGMLPFYVSNKQMHLTPCKRIAPITEMFAGRCGFILREFAIEAVTAIIDFLYQKPLDWDTFQLTLVDASESDLLLAEVLRHKRVRFERVLSETSPYILLTGTWDEYLRSLPSKFRWQLRNRLKKLGESGKWHYQEYRTPEEAKHFMQSMLEIEKASWKQGAGTSVTVNDDQELFFNTLATVAAKKGWLSGHLLELNGEPIGYILGLTYNGIFYGLKETFKVDKKHLSPGHMIQMLTIEQLYKRNISIYDFMGGCEPHKLVWTSNTYSRSTLFLYNKTSRGLTAWIGGKMAKAANNFVTR
jgi:Acetyltransferase (GNAT) domain